MEVLIDKYIENPEVLSRLIRGNDMFERLQKKYNTQQNEGRIKIAKENELIQNKNENQKIVKISKKKKKKKNFQLNQN